MSKKATIRRCCAWHDYKWPKELSSGVMFFDGQRITIEEFAEYVDLLRRAGALND